jgi:hypothetical protein
MHSIALCPDPVFIIGSPRSGTSILAGALAQHSALWTSAESHVLHELYGTGYLESDGWGVPLADRAFHKAKDRPEGTWLGEQRVERAEFLEYLGIGFNALFTSRSGGRRWIDQTPVYTLMVEVLADMFPGARFLHILRDGRRVVNSMVHFLEAVNPDLKVGMEKAGSLPPWATEFRAACQTWATFVERALAFDERCPARSLTVVNEELVRDPDAGFRAILDFLGGAPEPGPAQFFRSNRINSSYRNDSQDPAWIQRLDEPWKTWSLEQKGLFAEEAGMLLIRCGFAVAEDIAGWDEAQRDEDLALIRRIRDVVETVVPSNATLIVVSYGDEVLMDLGGRKTWHFPQDDKGGHVTQYPDNSWAAIAHLESLRARGGTHLLLPSTAFWWLDDYPDFSQHLRSRYRTVREDAACIIFALA